MTKISKVPARSPERREKTAKGLSLNPDVNCDMVLVIEVLKMIWYQAGMVGPVSQLSQSTVMFAVNLKKLFKVIVEPEKIEQNKPDKQMKGGTWIPVEPI